MTHESATWTLILAGGDGARLSSLTTASNGQCIPKQYCSLQGGASLLHETIRRALTISPPQQICAVVAEQHRQWWQQALWPIEESNIIVQPQNKGTANGILLPLLHILDIDPNANIVLLPSDHHLEDEMALRESIQSALRSLRTYPDKIMLLGIEPEEADSDLGYIMPDTRSRLRPQPVMTFIEKPGAQEAQQLISEGALWNSFIVVARAKALLQLFVDKHQSAVLRMQIAMFRQVQDAHAIRNLYATLREVDFSRHILPGMEPRLRVVQVRKCGWSDLGTPKRVVRTLQKTQRQEWTESRHTPLNLALQHEQQRERPSALA
jgi:mannose-1-phosphate guanylyltransferase